jgi:hypothetical protein
LIISRNDCDQLRYCYRCLKKGINQTSLVVVHGPIGKVSVNGSIRLNPFVNNITVFNTDENNFYKYSPNSPLLNDIGNSRFYQLLTGDINLKERLNSGTLLFNLIENHFNDIIEHIIIGLLPHHGSKRKWASEILKTEINSQFWVVSASCPRLSNYRHPSFKLIKTIQLSGYCCYWSNQIRSVDIQANKDYQNH